MKYLILSLLFSWFAYAGGEEYGLNENYQVQLEELVARVTDLNHRPEQAEESKRLIQTQVSGWIAPSVTAATMDPLTRQVDQKKLIRVLTHYGELEEGKIRFRLVSWFLTDSASPLKESEKLQLGFAMALNETQYQKQRPLLSSKRVDAISTEMVFFMNKLSFSQLSREGDPNPLFGNGKIKEVFRESIPFKITLFKKFLEQPFIQSTFRELGLDRKFFSDSLEKMELSHIVYLNEVAHHLPYISSQESKSALEKLGLGVMMTLLHPHCDRFDQRFYQAVGSPLMIKLGQIRIEEYREQTTH